MTIAEQLGFTAEELDWLERRKLGDLTPRQHLRVNELQTRAWLMRMPEGLDRDALLAECLALRDEMDAVTGESTMKQITDLATRHMALHARVTKAVGPG